jgi:thiol-disulfide isomerase/thioredoxin
MRTRLFGPWILLCVHFVMTPGTGVSIAADKKPVPAATSFDEAAQRKAVEEKLKSFFEYRNSIYAKLEKAKNDKDQNQIYLELSAREEQVCRELVDISLQNPKTEAAKQALIWVVNKPGRGIGGDYGGEFDRAAGLLVRNHGDDAEVAGVCMWMNNILGFSRDSFLYGMAAAAKSRETKGLTQYALAQYVSKKALYAAGAQKNPGRLTFERKSKGENGKVETKTVDAGDETNAYIESLRVIDSEALKRKAESIYEEIIRDYSDIPGKRIGLWEMARWLQSDPPMREGVTLKPDEVDQIRKILARPVPTLGELAKQRLDEMNNLVEGKPAPEIDAEGVDGKRFKLSDYRGKVVVLIFWGTWCGPCMAEVPHEREMAEKYKDQPVALLGVDCDDDRAKALEVMKKEGITWPNWYDGEPGEGPIAKAYHIRAYPTVMVIDAEGKIRLRNGRGKELDDFVDKLLAEMKASKPAD